MFPNAADVRKVTLRSGLHLHLAASELPNKEHVAFPLVPADGLESPGWTRSHPYFGRISSFDRRCLIALAVPFALWLHYQRETSLV
jgi:hypothetical protein